MYYTKAVESYIHTLISANKAETTIQNYTRTLRSFGSYLDSVGIQNGFMCPNDVRELEDLDLIPEELGGNKYMVNGNMVDLKNVGAAYTGSQSRVEEKPPEETNTNRRKKT